MGRGKLRLSEFLLSEVEEQDAMVGLIVPMRTPEQLDHILMSRCHLDVSMI